ncbi:MAG: NAD(P)/FAD-dependent oxidoreductase [Acidimicrobiales bacterium]
MSPPSRDPVHDKVTADFIGGGFGGLVTGARLVEAGIDVRIIEKGGDVGGTWYWNRYPGAQCDTHSFVYLPLLEETGHMPSEKYAHGPEILEHSRRIARHFGLYDKALLSTEVTDVAWDDADARWIIRTNRGDEIRAQFVLMSTGPLHRPKLPGIPGIETFGGHSFHTSRWDYDYTGGDPNGAPLEKLADKRVGIIGTGATSVQCIPISPPRAKNCSSSSEPRARSTCATTPRPTPTGSPAKSSNLGGRRSGSAISPPTRPASTQKKTW